MDWMDPAEKPSPLRAPAVLKIYYMLGLSGTSSYDVFVYMCICVFVLLYLHV